jgi:hypothetical protein
MTQNKRNSPCSTSSSIPSGSLHVEEGEGDGGGGVLLLESDMMLGVLHKKILEADEKVLVGG